MVFKKEKISGNLANKLNQEGIIIEKGLSKKEFEKIEKVYEVILPRDFIDFYSEITLVGGEFYNWKDFSPENVLKIKKMMTQYIENGIEFDIKNNDFWYENWGVKPEDTNECVSVFLNHFSKVPKLLPIYSY